MGNARGAVLIAPGIAAVGIALGVADENGDIALEDVFVHQHRVAALGAAQIDHMLIVLAVVGGDLPGVVKLVKKLLPEYLFHLRLGGSGVQAVGDDEENILLFNTAGVKLVKAGSDGDFSVACGLDAAFYDIGNHEDDAFSRRGKLPERRHAYGVADTLQSGVIKAVPILRQAGGIGHGFAGDKHIGIVGQLRRHEAVAVFKIKFHRCSPHFPRYLAIMSIYSSG